MLGIIGGIAAIWVYAAIRPRFGAGIQTAVYAGFIVWLVGDFLINARLMWLVHLFSHHLTVYTTLGALITSIVSTIAGAALYKE